MIHTRRGTRRREADTSGSSPILLLAHSLYSNDTSGVLLLLLQQVNGMVNGSMLDRVCGGPLYSSNGRFPPSTNMGTLTTAFYRIRTTFPPKLSLSLCHVGLAEPLWPPLATAFLWYTAWWVLMSDGRCRGLVGWFGLFCGPSLLV